MYAAHFGLRDNPFSITPDPRYLYMSPHHREALAHLLYGTGEDGGFVQLTGEVGTGKTTLIRTLLEQKLENVDVALCLNPRLTVEECVATICDELKINYHTDTPTLKTLVDALNHHLLESHAQGRRTVLIIDEAQNLSRNVLEQLRLLSNLETHRHKLLRIILVGQPELQGILAGQDMRPLAQRITARYHLRPLNCRETAVYILHRLQIAGGRNELFSRAALRAAYQLTNGIPRLINVVCDRALLGAYSRNLKRISATTLRLAAHEALQGNMAKNITSKRRAWLITMTLLAGIIGITLKLGFLPFPAPATPLSKLFNAPPLQADKPSSLSATSASEPDGNAVSTDPQEQTDFKALFSDQPQESALERLLIAWGEDPILPSDVPPCEYLKSRSLRCLSGRGNWDELRNLNHPVILRLATPKGETRQILLLHLDGSTALLDLSGHRLPITLSLLELLWTGDYLLLWRLQTSVDLIAPGSRSEAVRWLRRRLSLAEGSAPVEEPLSEYFDPDLRERVKHFQRNHGLEPDGLVGARTMIYLNNVAPVPGTPLLTATVTERTQ
jgi:general secretion pathway protein A